jgi:hypothetical protein
MYIRKRKFLIVYKFHCSVPLAKNNIYFTCVNYGLHHIKCYICHFWTFCEQRYWIKKTSLPMPVILRRLLHIRILLAKLVGLVGYKNLTTRRAAVSPKPIALYSSCIRNKSLIINLLHCNEYLPFGRMESGTQTKWKPEKKGVTSIAAVNNFERRRNCTN